jgi:hypothetical protein
MSRVIVTPMIQFSSGRGELNPVVLCLVYLCEGDHPFLPASGSNPRIPLSVPATRPAYRVPGSSTPYPENKEKLTFFYPSTKIKRLLSGSVGRSHCAAHSFNVAKSDPWTVFRFGESKIMLRKRGHTQVNAITGLLDVFLNRDLIY